MATPPPAVRLRPVERGDLEWLAAMEADPVAVGEHNWGGEVDRDELQASMSERFARDGYLGDGEGRLVVEVDGIGPIGDVAWRTARWGPTAKSRCFSIGIALLPRHRGHGYGTAAQRRLVDHLFETTDVHRVQSDTALDNPAEQRALEKAGFSREGIVRQAEWRNGRYHDHVLFSVLRDEWETGRG